MSETAERVPASVGPTQRAVANAAPQNNASENANNSNDSNAGSNNGENQNGAQANAAAAAASGNNNAAPEINEDAVTKFLESKGITGFKDISELKDKLATPAAPAPEPTPEEKAKAEAELDKRMLDLYLESGGTIEKYATVKQVASMDLKELSEKELVRELKSQGFEEPEIAALVRERYYQINPDELEQDLVNGETNEEFEARKNAFKKKHDYFSEKLSTRSKHLKETANGVLNNLRTAILNSDASLKAQQEEERKLSAKTDEILSTLPRKVTYDLGKTLDGSADIPPIEDEISEDVIKSVGELLKNKDSRNNFLQTPDGELNIENIAKILVENKSLKEALKLTYLEAETRAVDTFRQRFPHNSPYSVGVGTNGSQSKASAADKKAPASVGKTQRVPVGQS